MPNAGHLKNNAKAALLLSVLLAIILLSNIADNANYSSLDKSITSIYKDRLMPASYLIELKECLYKKQMLAPSNKEQQTYDARINAAIKAYDATYLTNEERKQWNMFKTYWKGADQAAHFDEMHNNLLSLTQIQVIEGKSLEKASHSTIAATLLGSHLEISLLTVLGIFSIALISRMDEKPFVIKQAQMN